MENSALMLIMVDLVEALVDTLLPPMVELHHLVKEVMVVISFLVLQLPT